MEFWGVEVKSGETVPVTPPDGRLIHISQACVGETKKNSGNDFIRLYAKKNETKYLLGILSYEKFPHLNFDLVFEADFELFHDSKHGSVHLAGYLADTPDMAGGDEESEDESDEDEPIPVSAKDNGKTETKQPKAADAKPEVPASKAKVKIVEPSKDNKQNEEDDDSDEDDDNDSEEEDSGEDEDMPNAEDDVEDDSSEEDEEESDEEDTPKEAENSKKRPANRSTPASDKKPKLVTPKKTDGKKPSVHVATPYPAKKAGKAAANNDNIKQQTPRSGGSFSCSTCSRSFGSDQALQSHSKAKHGAK